VAPGIVDTKMQDEIRDVNETSFSDVGRFIKYKAENKLIKLVDVAQKLCKLIENSDNVQQVLIDLREIDL
jgi:benzil reductase ((S)-benzoin forming)